MTNDNALETIRANMAINPNRTMDKVWQECRIKAWEVCGHGFKDWDKTTEELFDCVRNMGQ